MTEKYRFKNREAFIKALDSVLAEQFIQERDIGNNRKHRYYPVAIKDAIADNIFQYWNVIDEKYNILQGMLVCTVKLGYVPSYPSADEQFCTGSAAVLIQSTKNALEYQLPAVRSEASGCALGSLGNVFGRNLSRKLKKDIDIPDDFSLRKKEEKQEAIPGTEKKEEKPKINMPF